MRHGASSTASDFDTRFTAPFDALYQVSPGLGRMPAVDPTLSITPPPLSRMSGTTACTMLKIDFTFMAKMRSNVASSTSSIGRLRCVMPALLTTMSGTPNALDGTLRPPVRHRRQRRDIGFDGNRTRSPIAVGDAAAWFSRMSTTATRAPSAAKRRAIPSPNPLPAPVTRAIFPRSRDTSRSSAVIDDDRLDDARNRAAP